MEKVCKRFRENGSRVHVFTFHQGRNSRFIDHYEFVNWMAILMRLEEVSKTTELGCETSLTQLCKYVWGIRNKEKFDLYEGMPPGREKKRVQGAFLAYQNKIVQYLVLMALEGLVEYKEVIDQKVGVSTRMLSRITPAGSDFYHKWKDYANRVLESDPFVTTKGKDRRIYE